MERLLGTDELQPGERESVFVDDIPALVVRLGDEYYVVEDVCSHDGQPLADGPIADGAITCPRHGAKFDLKTGAALCMPATKGIRTFDVEVKDGAVWAAEKKKSVGAEAVAEKAVSLGGASTATAADTEAATTDAEPTADGNSASSESDYLEALRQVIDPELMINIVDLGLIYSVEQDEENNRRVKVDMTLTSPACPAGPQLVQQSKMALERLHDVDEAAITMVMSPPWSPERMTDDAKDQLGIF
jgi:metal-sulfur cluster biosynthetic enzyme/nitrite reductase/ring-hydroxylating ferredoxin subunit